MGQYSGVSVCKGDQLLTGVYPLMVCLGSMCEGKLTFGAHFGVGISMWYSGSWYDTSGTAVEVGYGVKTGVPVVGQ